MTFVVKKLGRLSDLAESSKAQLIETQARTWDQTIECRRKNQKIRVRTERLTRGAWPMEKLIVSTLEQLRRELPKMRKDEDFELSRRAVGKVRAQRGQTVHLSAPIGEILRSAK